MILPGPELLVPLWSMVADQMSDRIRQKQMRLESDEHQPLWPSYSVTASQTCQPLSLLAARNTLSFLPASAW